MNSDTSMPDLGESSVLCLICSQPLAVDLCKNRKTSKPSITLYCPENPSHFRAFIHEKEYVDQVLERLEQIS